MFLFIKYIATGGLQYLFIGYLNCYQLYVWQFVTMAGRILFGSSNEIVEI